MTRTPYWTLWKSFGCDVSDKSAVFSWVTIHADPILPFHPSLDGRRAISFPLFRPRRWIVDAWTRRHITRWISIYWSRAETGRRKERGLFVRWFLAPRNKQGETIFRGIVRAEAYRTITASIVRVFDVDFAHDAISSNLSKYVETRYICTSRTETMIQRCRMLQWIAEVA